MDNLFEQIKSSNANAKFPELPSGAWSSFESYSHKRNHPSSFPWLPFLVSALLILLIGSNIYWWNTNRVSGEFKKSSTIISDTIYITKYVNEVNRNLKAGKDLMQVPKLEYEKLVQTQNQLSQVLLSINQLKSQVNQLSNNQKNNIARHAIPEGINSVAQEIKSPKEFAFVEPSSLNTDDVFNIRDLQSLLKPLQTLDPGQVHYQRINKYYYTPQVLLLDGEKRKTFLQSISPKSFSLFINGGYISLFNKDFERYNGQSFGVGVSTLFSKKIRANIGFQYSSAKAKIEELNRFPDLIVVEPPENGTLHEVYLDDKSYGFRSSIDYLFKPIFRFRPFVGLGYDFNHSQFENIQYEFSTPNGSKYIKIEEALNKSSNHYLSIYLGTDINLRPNLDAFIAFSYYQNMKGEGMDYYFIRPGLYFHF